MATQLDEKKPATSKLASPNNIFPGNRLQGDSGSSDAPAGATPTQSPAAASAVARLAGPSELYMQDRAKEMSGQWGSGNYAQAAGTAARTAVQGLGMYGIELADKVATPVIGAVGKFASGLIGSDASAGQPVQSIAAAPAAPAKAAGTPATVPGDAMTPSLKPGLTNNLGTMPDTPMQAAPAARTTALPDGVYQHGRGQFSDQAGSMGFAPGFTGKPSQENDAAAGALDRRTALARMGGYSYAPESNTAPSSPNPSAAGTASTSSGVSLAPSSAPSSQPAPQNQRAASSLAAMNSPILAEQQGGVPAFNAPSVAHSGNDWSARQRLKDMETSASSITNTERWGGRGASHNPAVLNFVDASRADLAAQGKVPDMQLKTNEINAGLKRTAMAEAGADRRATLAESGASSRAAGQLGLGLRRLSLDQQRAGSEDRLREPQIRAAERQGQLQEAYFNAKTQGERDAIASQMRAYSGKDEADWKVQVTPATKNVDGSTTAGSVIRYNSRTGDVQDVGGVGGSSQSLPPGMNKQVGTAGGKPVYEDAKGNRFVGG
ncbi:hypothetical protein COAQ111491_14110 [Comamonas aquatilis]|uniref:hypothetical protein n=1 Tax=Comamonas aquatilis TaxID=1778406 RepID=UPI0039EE518B